MIRAVIAGAGPGDQSGLDESRTGPVGPVGAGSPTEPALRGGDDAYLMGRYDDARLAYAAAIDDGSSIGWVGFAVAAARSRTLGRRWAGQVEVIRRLHAAGHGRVSVVEVAGWWLGVSAPSPRPMNT